MPALPLAIDRWLPRYAMSRLRRREPLRHAWVAVADHFEPYWRSSDDVLARERVRLWRSRWPEIAQAYEDSEGRPPVYTFFYAQEEYRAEPMDDLAALVREGIADVEIHLHHDGEGEADFLERMAGFRDLLASRHGLLRSHAGRPTFGFIHGNWALDNARPDGRWCGLDNEIGLLARLGCYADFTLPCVPSPAQAGPVNRVYWATDDPRRPRSHDRGTPAVRGGPTGELLLVPGPLALNWEGRPPWRPRIDTGELAANWPPSAHRVRLWLDNAPRIEGHAFVKLFTHGTQERNSAALLGGALDQTYRLFVDECRRRGVALHFASTWRMRQAIDALLAPKAAA